MWQGKRGRPWVSSYEERFDPVFTVIEEEEEAFVHGEEETNNGDSKFKMVEDLDDKRKM
jgi:hypothetical protein